MQIAGFNESSDSRSFDSSSEDVLKADSNEQWMALEVHTYKYCSMQLRIDLHIGSEKAAVFLSE